MLWHWRRCINCILGRDFSFSGLISCRPPCCYRDSCTARPCWHKLQQDQLRLRLGVLVDLRRDPACLAQVSQYLSKMLVSRNIGTDDIDIRLPLAQDASFVKLGVVGPCRLEKAHVANLRAKRRRVFRQLSSSRLFLLSWQSG